MSSEEESGRLHIIQNRGVVYLTNGIKKMAGEKRPFERFGILGQESRYRRQADGSLILEGESDVFFFHRALDLVAEIATEPGLNFRRITLDASDSWFAEQILTHISQYTGIEVEDLTPPVKELEHHPRTVLGDEWYKLGNPPVFYSPEELAQKREELDKRDRRRRW